MNDKTLPWINKVSLAVLMFNRDTSAYKDTLTDGQIINVLNAYIKRFSGPEGVGNFTRMISEMAIKNNDNKSQN